MSANHEAVHVLPDGRIEVSRAAAAQAHNESCDGQDGGYDGDDVEGVATVPQTMAR